MEATPLDLILAEHGEEPQRLYPMEDAAGILKITDKALRLKVWRGEITPLKRSPRRYAGITHEELDRYLVESNEGRK